MRSHLCGAVTEQLADQTVTLCGWVDRARDLGGLVVISLRDYKGIIQVVVDPDNKEAFAVATQLRNEFCVKITGKVKLRPESQWNTDMATGKVELYADNVEILNTAAPIPMLMNDDDGEDIRLKYRYLDMRRPRMQHNMRIRAALYKAIRSHLDGDGFCEFETPILTKATPEGARDYLVPSRTHQGSFFALPPSPQLFKQLLMMSGFERYYQIVKCFRDEDLRADRQPEFTQIDCEMSFVEQEDILNTFEGLAKHIFKKFKNIDFTSPFKRMPYSEAMAKYGSDKPDLRFGMEINEITELAKGKNFKIFDDAEYIGGICAKNITEKYSRKKIDKLTEFVKKPQIGALGLIWVKYNTDGTFKSSVDKFFNQDDLKKWAEKFEAQPNDMIFVISGKTEKSQQILGDLRLELARDLNLLDNFR